MKNKTRTQFTIKFCEEYVQKTKDAGHISTTPGPKSNDRFQKGEMHACKIQRTVDDCRKEKASLLDGGAKIQPAL